MLMVGLFYVSVSVFVMFVLISSVLVRLGFCVNVIVLMLLWCVLFWVIIFLSNGSVWWMWLCDVSLGMMLL